jgi:hypothetical protein
MWFAGFIAFHIKLLHMAFAGKERFMREEETKPLQPFFVAESL